MKQIIIYLCLIVSITISQSILIKNGTVHTVSHGVLSNTDILIKNGIIKSIGKNLTGAEITIDATNQHVYPGLIAAYTTLGLIEFEAVRATDDINEVGSITPEVESHVAFNPSSQITPTVRVNGITTALVAPKGGLLAGQSSILNLDGWNKEDMMVSKNNGLHIEWPRMHTVKHLLATKPAKKQADESADKVSSLYRIFKTAKSYHQKRLSNKNTPVDLRLESIRKTFTDSKVFIHADEIRQIEAAIEFKKHFKLDVVIVGGLDSWKCTELLISTKTSVILGQTQKLPLHTDDDYDINFKLPALLEKAGINFAISGAHIWTGENWGVRNLPFQAGQAVAFGLDKERALKAITLSAAEILDIDKRLGSIDIGKHASLVISKGDILDQLTHKVTHVLINGKEVSLNTKQTDLYKKYSNR